VSGKSCMVESISVEPPGQRADRRQNIPPDRRH